MHQEKWYNFCCKGKDAFQSYSEPPQILKKGISIENDTGIDIGRTFIEEVIVNGIKEHHFG